MKPKNKELRHAIRFTKKHGLHQYPYDFSLNRDVNSIDVFEDSTSEMCYVLHKGKRLYWPRDFSTDEIKESYFCLARVEQHPDSPHCYLSDTFDVTENSVIMDIGAAEGIFTLSVIERVKKAYLLECDPRWLPPLKATFAPYMSKAVIIEKFLSDCTTIDKNTITLDDLMLEIGGGGGPVDFIKADIEGCEKALLEGGKKIFRSHKPDKIAIACYHRPEDEKNLKNILHTYGFTTHFSSGYMIPMGATPWGGDFLSPPYLKRGIIRGQK